MKDKQVLERLRGRLIVSCQALEHEAMYAPDRSLMGYFARAAARGGAGGIRANTVRDILAIREQVSLPVIGIIKQEYDGSDVYITPTMAEVDALCAIRCDVVAMDATARPRPGGAELAPFFAQCREKYPDQLFMADCSTLEEGVRAAEMGFDVVSTTLAGYTAYTKGTVLPDLAMLKRLRQACDCFLIAEGGIWTPEQLAQALTAGADAAVVGTAITRPMEITRRFCAALEVHHA